MEFRIIVTSAGNIHSLALVANGKIYAWGRNDYGQLGDGTLNNKHSPQMVRNIPGKIIKVACGNYHTLVFIEGNKVYGWGGNVNGELGEWCQSQLNPMRLSSTDKGMLLSTFGKGGKLLVLPNWRKTFDI